MAGRIQESSRLVRCMSCEPKSDCHADANCGAMIGSENAWVLDRDWAWQQGRICVLRTCIHGALKRFISRSVPQGSRHE